MQDSDQIKLQELYSKMLLESATQQSWPEKVQQALDRIEIINGVKTIKGYVDVSNCDLTSLPFEGVHVTGNFNCSSNKLISLKGAPQRVDGDFIASFNRSLKQNLMGAPEYVGGHCYVFFTDIVSLEGAPQYVGGDFHCSDTNITSLKGAPQYVGGEFLCFLCKLKSLKGAPTHVGGKFQCATNKLTSLDGAPQHVDGDFDCRENKITSLDGAPQQVDGVFDCSENYNLKSLDNFKTIANQYKFDNFTDTQVKQHIYNQQMRSHMQDDDDLGFGELDL